MSNYPSINRIADLQQLIADFSEVKRAVQIADKRRLENDTEHSFGLALTCWFIAPKVAPLLNLEKIILYALIHDMVELHSGDTFAFDEEEVKTKHQREKQSEKRITQDWPDFPEMTNAIKAYEDRTDPEAKFVYTIDKILPGIMVNLGEKDKFWKRYKVTRKMYENEKNKKMQLSPEALPYLEMINKWLADPDYFYKPEEK